MRVGRHSLPADSAFRTVQDPVWSITAPGHRWSGLWGRSARAAAPPAPASTLTDLRVPVDAAEVQLAEARLVELEDLLISSASVYCQGVVMASRIVSDGTGPLYAPRRRGELRERVVTVLAALRGAR